MLPNVCDSLYAIMVVDLTERGWVHSTRSLLLFTLCNVVSTSVLCTSRHLAVSIVSAMCLLREKLFLLCDSRLPYSLTRGVNYPLVVPLGLSLCWLPWNLLYMCLVNFAFAAWALITLPTLTGFPCAALTLDIICSLRV